MTNLSHPRPATRPASGSALLAFGLTALLAHDALPAHPRPPSWWTDIGRRITNAASFPGTGSALDGLRQLHPPCRGRGGQRRCSCPDIVDIDGPTRATITLTMGRDRHRFGSSPSTGDGLRDPPEARPSAVEQDGHDRVLLQISATNTPTCLDVNNLTRRGWLPGQRPDGGSPAGRRTVAASSSRTATVSDGRRGRRQQLRDRRAGGGDNGRGGGICGSSLGTLQRHRLQLRRRTRSRTGALHVRRGREHRRLRQPRWRSDRLTFTALQRSTATARTWTTCSGATASGCATGRRRSPSAAIDEQHGDHGHDAAPCPSTVVLHAIGAAADPDVARGERGPSSAARSQQQRRASRVAAIYLILGTLTPERTAR